MIGTFDTGISLLKIINVDILNTNQNDEAVLFVDPPNPAMESLPHASVCGFRTLSNVSIASFVSSTSSNAVPKHTADSKATFAPCPKDGQTE
jgi:hypothetical protein